MQLKFKCLEYVTKPVPVIVRTIVSTYCTLVRSERAVKDWNFFC